MNRTVLATLDEEQILQRFKAIKYQTEKKTRTARTWLTMTSQPQVTSRYTGRENATGRSSPFFAPWSSAFGAVRPRFTTTHQNLVREVRK